MGRLTNETPLVHITYHGFTVKAKRADLVGGIIIEMRPGKSLEDMLQAAFEFGQWHGVHIWPELSHYSGPPVVKTNHEF